jgi:hypothetical protein
MICPQCKAEYRRGFTVCADCGIPLVGSTDLARASTAEDESAATPGDPNEDPFCSFWKGTDLRVCTEVCTVLDEAGIPHKTIRRQDHLFNFNNQVPYEVGVPASLYEEAELAIKDAFGTDEESGEGVVPLLPPPKEEPRSRQLRIVWVGDSAMQCAGVCDALKKAGIDYHVADSRVQAGYGLDERYEIGVAETDYKRAKVIGGRGVVDFSEEPEDQEIMEIPDTDNLEWGTANNARRGLDQVWYPDDATSLAWEGEPADSRWMIEMSLKENDIRMRWEMQDAKPRLFVLPEDDERARKIVREIVEGQPPV